MHEVLPGSTCCSHLWLCRWPWRTGAPVGRRWRLWRWHAGRSWGSPEKNPNQSHRTRRDTWEKHRGRQIPVSVTTTASKSLLFILQLINQLVDYKSEAFNKHFPPTLGLSNTVMATYDSVTYNIPQPSFCPSMTAVVSACSCLTPSVGGWRFFNKTILSHSCWRLLENRLINTRTIEPLWSSICSHASWVLAMRSH